MAYVNRQVFKNPEGTVLTVRPPEQEASVAALRLSPPVANGEFWYGRNADHKIEALLRTPTKKGKKGEEIAGKAEDKEFTLQELAEFLKEGKYELKESEVI